MLDEKIIDLIVRELKGKLDAEDAAELLIWVNSSERNAQFYKQIRSKRNIHTLIKSFHAAELAKPGAQVKLGEMLDEVYDQQARVEVSEGEERRKRVVLPRTAIFAAAAMLTIVGVVYFLADKGKSTTRERSVVAVGSESQRWGQEATLTLSTGRKIVLDTAANGQIAQDEGSFVRKSSGGQLDYVPEGAALGSSKIAYNTLAIPKGGTFRVMLPDQSIVVLNSESSLTYPTSFSPNSARVVQLTGEGYFEVRHEAARPFYVQVAGGLIEALGTSFDVKAYSDEPSAKATLFDGVVRVVQGGDSAILNPGQQAVMKSGRLQVLSAVDTDAIVGWKNGAFVFSGAPLDEVMRQLARWWDIDVRYEVGSDTQSFSGKLNKNLTANEALNILIKSGYHINVNGRTVTVRP